MSIERVRLENFRGFRDATIEIKPLTVLLGANSSGKSSFGHAMATMAHSQSKYGGTPNNATLTPGTDSDDWPIDLGMLGDLRTYGETGPVFITLKTSEGSVRWGFGLDSDQSQDLLISYIEWPRGRKDSSGSIDRDAGLSLPFPEAIPPSGIISKGVVELGNDRTHRIFKRLNDQQWRESPGDRVIQIVLMGLLLNSATSPGETGEAFNVPVLNDLQAFFENLTYLRATRRRPTRAFDESRIKTRQVVGYGGEKTAYVLQHMGNQQIEFNLPPLIPSAPSEVEALLEKNWEEYSGTLLDLLGIWLQRLDLAEKIEAIERKEDRSLLEVLVTLSDQPAHDITEVGFGVSQVLPVLLAGLLQKNDSLLIVDLPEAHLHPWPQAQLADFFCSIAQPGRKVLVETHSEMFINQLRLRAELSEELNDNIAIYFIDSPKEGYCCQPELVKLGTEGEMRWPVGFMQEALDRETKISAVRAAKRRRAK